jgi:hypothetical protein
MYDSSELSGQFVVTVLLSNTRGQPLHDTVSSDTTPLDFTVTAASDDMKDLQLASGRISLGTSGRLLRFSLRRLTPRLTPYQISFDLQGQSKYSVTTELYYLPARDEGSSVKLDSLNGGMLVANNSTGFAYEHFIPFGLYADCTSVWNPSRAEIASYRDFGVNTISQICDYQRPGLDELYNDMNLANMWYEHSFRLPLQDTSILQQISRWKDHSNLLSWHVGAASDQPSDMEEIHALLRKHDPYHPVGLAFSCEETGEAISTADYITESRNILSSPASPSSHRKPDLPVNRDDENTANTFESIDAYSAFIAPLDDGEKPFWADLQTTSSDSHDRAMTSAELWSSVILTINHNAKAVFSELDGMTDTLAKSYGSISSAINTPEVAQLLLGGAPTRLEVHDNAFLDVSYWRKGSQVLIAIANLNRSRTSENVSIELPFAARRIASQPWGSLSWSLTSGTVLSTYGLDAFATSILIFDT